MLYIPGEEVKIQFTVPSADGTNTTGLTWTKALLKDGVPVTTGDEFTSLVFSEEASWYSIVFTPDADSTSVYLIHGISTGDYPEVYEEMLEPNLPWLFMIADQVHDFGSSPKTIEVLMPDGSTRLIKHKYRQSGRLKYRERL